MRKILFIIIILLLSFGAYTVILDGITMGPININGVKNISKLSDELEEKIYDASVLTDVKYKEANIALSNALNSLQSKREEYESKVSLSDEEDIRRAMTTEKHEIQFLWAKIGNYATKNGLKLTLNILEGDQGSQGEKNLEFTLEGAYKGITNFLYNLEDDSRLKFRIRGFNILPITVERKNGDEVEVYTTLQAKFYVNEVNIDLG